MEPLNKKELLNELQEVQDIIGVAIPMIKKGLDEQIKFSEGVLASHKNDDSLGQQEITQLIKSKTREINEYIFQIGKLDSIMEETNKKITNLQDRANDIKDLNLLESQIQTIRKEAFEDIKIVSGDDLEKMLNTSPKKSAIHDENDKSFGEMFGAFLRQEAKSALETIQNVFRDAGAFFGGILNSVAKTIGFTSSSKESPKEDFSKEPKETQQEKRDIELTEVKEMPPPRVIKISAEHIEQKAGVEEKNSVSVAAKRWGSNRPKSDFQEKIKYRGNKLTEVAEHTSTNKSTGNNESTVEKMERQATHHS